MTPPGKEQIVLHASEDFKNALGKYASDHEMAMAEVIRKATATLIGYDLGSEPARMRTPKYATPEEAKRAALDRAALIRWGNATSSRLLVEGKMEPATIIARAVGQKDYETLNALKAASAAKGAPTEAGTTTEESEEGTDDDASE